MIHTAAATGKQVRPDEKEAIRECRRGRIEGLQVLYELHKERVFRTCFRILSDLSLAEDAAQDVFLRVFDRIRSYGERSEFSTWLYRLTVNHALNVLERERRRQKAPGRDEPSGRSPAPDEALARKESSEKVQELLSSLPPKHRTVLVLREIEGLSYKEIAGVLRIPSGTVMSRLSRAREDLKRRWLRFQDPGE